MHATDTTGASEPASPTTFTPTSASNAPATIADLPTPQTPVADSIDRFALAAFDYQPNTRVIYGAGTLNQLGELAQQVPGRRILLVTDTGIVRAGHVERAQRILRTAGLEVALWDQVRENPTTADVRAASAFAADFQPDLLIGLGGGSSMDTAKGLNFLLTNGGMMQDYWGVNKATKPMLPLLAIPTTAGTGSEAQSFALISDEVTHVKMACGDKKAAARIALLDPELTLTQPERVTVVVGIDAISHALESFVTTRRNPVSQLFAREAWKLLANGFARVLAVPTDIQARGQMLLGAHWAGAAIENSMLGATHATANPLTATLGTPHGTAIGLMLPHILRFNAAVVDPLYDELLAILRATAPDTVPSSATQAHISAGAVLADWVTAILQQAGLPTHLQAIGVEESMVPDLAQQASKQWTGTFNPRPVQAHEWAQIYHQALLS